MVSRSLSCDFFQVAPRKNHEKKEGILNFQSTVIECECTLLALSKQILEDVNRQPRPQGLLASFKVAVTEDQKYQIR